MSKQKLYQEFSAAVLAKKVNHNSNEYNAITVFFGVNSEEDLISAKALAAYSVGKELVNKILKEN
jgi:NAD(P)H-flavin reductase